MNIRNLTNEEFNVLEVAMDHMEEHLYDLDEDEVPYLKEKREAYWSLRRKILQLEHDHQSII